MKNTISLIVLLVVGFSFNSIAQKQKIGHLDSRKVLELMPQRDSVEASFQARVAAIDTEISEMQATLQQDYNSFLARKDTMSPAWNQIQQENIESSNQRLQNYQMQMQQEVGQMQQTLYDDLIVKITEATKVVADAGAFSYILDNGNGLTMYAGGGIDITNLVMKELGITVVAE